MFATTDLIAPGLTVVGEEAYKSLVAILAADDIHIPAAEVVRILGAAGRTVADLQRDVDRLVANPPIIA